MEFQRKQVDFAASLAWAEVDRQSRTGLILFLFTFGK